MRFIVFANDHADVSRFGNKGIRLAHLASGGFNVPAFFVVCPEAFEDNRFRDDARAETENAMQVLCPDGVPVAVRSSSLEEDGKENSFAGQLASYLNVPAWDVAARVADVSRSAH